MLRRLPLVPAVVVALVALAGCSSGSSSSPRTEAPKGPAASPFCTTMRSIGSITANVTDADAAKGALKKLTDTYQELAKTAPPELATDMQLVASNAKRQYDILARNDFDFEKVPNDPDYTKLAEDVRSDAATKAGQHLTDYGRKVCGVNVDAFDVPTTTTVG